MDSRYNRRIDTIGEIDLASVTCAEIRRHFGTGVALSTGSGREKKYTYRSGVQTDIGDIREDIWYQVAEHVVQRNGELWLVDALTEWERTHNFANRKPTELRQEALDLYAFRIFDNEEWVCYLPFNRKYRPEVLVQATIVTVTTDCCKTPGEVTQAQIDRAYVEQISCPHCGRWSTFSILPDESPPWDIF